MFRGMVIKNYLRVIINNFLTKSSVFDIKDNFEVIVGEI